jgi:hypothetical protein
MGFEDIKKKEQVLLKTEAPIAKKALSNNIAETEQNEKDGESLEKIEEAQIHKDQAAIEAIRKKLTGESGQIENLSQMSLDFEDADKVSQEEIFHASNSNILKIKLHKDKEASRAVKIAESILNDEENLKMFLSGNLRKEILDSSGFEDENKLKMYLDSSKAYFAFENFKGDDRLVDTLKKYATDYFQTKYSLELIKKSKSMIKNIMPEIYQDFSVKVDTNFHKESHSRGKEHDTIMLNYGDKYKETNGIPSGDKGQDLLSISHEYAHGIFDRVIDPEGKIDQNDPKEAKSIYLTLSEGFCLFVQNYLAKEIEKNQKLSNDYPELKDMIEKNNARIEGIEQGAEDNSTVYPEGWKIAKKIFETEGLEGYINFIKSIDPEKAISTSRDNPVYQEALETGIPYKLLEIIGKKTD